MLTLAAAIYLTSRALQLMQGRQYEVASRAVFEILGSEPITAYDAECVALAEELDVQRVTADRRLHSAFPVRSVLLEDFAGR